MKMKTLSKRRRLESELSAHAGVELEQLPRFLGGAGQEVPVPEPVPAGWHALYGLRMPSSEVTTSLPSYHLNIILY